MEGDAVDDAVRCSGQIGCAGDPQRGAGEVLSAAPHQRLLLAAHVVDAHLQPCGGTIRRLA
eukprot:5791274-Pyramimonas_sp.AAC.1